MPRSVISAFNTTSRYLDEILNIYFGNLVKVSKGAKIRNQYIEDIQMFLLNMSFISRVKWTIFIFHEWRSHE